MLAMEGCRGPSAKKVLEWEPLSSVIPRQGTRFMDLDLPGVQAEVLKNIRLGAYFYTHFGILCSSWSPLFSMLNNGTRQAAFPSGDGSLPRERVGNLQARFVARACAAQGQVNGFWSIENPRASFLWKFPPIRKLMDGK